MEEAMMEEGRGKTEEGRGKRGERIWKMEHDLVECVLSDCDVLLPMSHVHGRYCTSFNVRIWAALLAPPSDFTLLGPAQAYLGLHGLTEHPAAEFPTLGINIRRRTSTDLNTIGRGPHQQAHQRS